MNIFSKPIVAALALTVCHASLASLIVGNEPSFNGKFNYAGNSGWLQKLDGKKSSKKNRESKSEYFKLDFEQAVKSIGYKKTDANDSILRFKKISIGGGSKGDWRGKGSKGDWRGKASKVDWRGKGGNVTVPEPGTVALLGIGILGLAINRRFYSK